MASHTRFPGVKTPNGVYGAQYQHPPHLMQNPAGVGNVIPTSVIAPPNMTATSVYGVQPGHQGMVGGCPVPGVYTRGVAPNPAAITAMQKQIKQKELEHQQQQEKIKKEYLFQEQKQRLKTMTGPNKGKQLSVDALMDSYLKPSGLKPNPPQPAWFPASESSNSAAPVTQNAVPMSQSDLNGFQTWQDRDVPDNYLQIYQSTLNAGGLIETSVLYPILLTSGLPRELLGHIWSLANQKIPGQLSKAELFLALAMIGFVQSGNNPSDLTLFSQNLRPFPVILSVPSTGVPVPAVPLPLGSVGQVGPAGVLPVSSMGPLAVSAATSLTHQQQLQQQQQQSVSVPHAASIPGVSLSASSSATSLAVTTLSATSLPAASLSGVSQNFTFVSSTASNLPSNVPSTLNLQFSQQQLQQQQQHAQQQHSSLSLSSNALTPQSSFTCPTFHSGSILQGPQSLTTVLSQDTFSSSSANPAQSSLQPANHQPLVQQQQSQQTASFSTTSVLDPSLSSSSSSLNNNNNCNGLPRPYHALSQKQQQLKGLQNSNIANGSSVKIPAASSSFEANFPCPPTSTSHSFPPLFPAGAASTPQLQQPPPSIAPTLPHSDPLVPSAKSSRLVGALAQQHPADAHPPLLPTPLAATAGDKYAAFKDLRSRDEDEDDFADFVAADVKELTSAEAVADPAPTPLPSAVNGVFAPSQPALVVPAKSVSATDKIIENLNNFSISSKSRKSSSDEFNSFAAAADDFSAPAAASDASWADFSHCADQIPNNVAFSEPSQQSQLQPQQRPQLFAMGAAADPRTLSTTATITTPAPDSTEDFGDFMSLRSGANSNDGITARFAPQVTSQLRRPQPGAVANHQPPPVSDGYHFSDPFFSPDNGDVGIGGGEGFANFGNSKESNSSCQDAKISSIASPSSAAAPPSYLDAAGVFNGIVGNGGLSRGSSIAAETQSVSSLELPAPTCATTNSQSDSDSLNGQSTENNSVTSDDPGSGANSLPQTNGDDYGLIGQRKISAAGLSSKQPLFGDRYSAVIEDISASESLPRKWTECLQSCHRMIAAANSNLSNLTSAAACLEFITAKKGLEYLTGIVEIYRVACRIFTSMKALGLVNKELGEMMRDIEIVWQNLTTFLAKSPSIMPEAGALDFSNCVVGRKPGSHVTDPTAATASEKLLCGVCLLNVDGRSKATNPVTGDSFKLAYGGRQYHASCANLWVNCVNPILPALVMPSPFM